MNSKDNVPPATPHLMEVVTTLKFARTHTRSGLGEDAFTVVRRGVRERSGMWLDGRTRHELADGAVLDAHRRDVDLIVDELLAAGCPRAGRDVVRSWLKKTGRQTYATSIMADIVRELKGRPEE
jgi:hypothetical protein